MKIYGIEIHVKEVLLIICILFFTILMNYVDISPYIKDYARKDRIVQIIAIFVISLTFIMSFRSTYQIKLDYILNALIVTFLFTLITKPKNLVEKEIENVKKVVKKSVENIKENNLIKN